MTVLITPNHFSCAPVRYVEIDVLLFALHKKAVHCSREFLFGCERNGVVGGAYNDFGVCSISHRPLQVIEQIKLLRCNQLLSAIFEFLLVGKGHRWKNDSQNQSEDFCAFHRNFEMQVIQL